MKRHTVWIGALLAACAIGIGNMRPSRADERLRWPSPRFRGEPRNHLINSGQSSPAPAAAGASREVNAEPGWHQIPSSKIRPLCPSYAEIQGVQSCPAVTADWSGGLFDSKRNRLVIQGGGHTAYFGNELYAIDLNASPAAAILIHDAAHGSAVSNVGTCPEAYLDGSPVSRHTYSGMVYASSIDKYIVYGGSRANCGYFSSALWEYDPAANVWTQVSQSGSEKPNPQANGSTPLLAYDPRSDAVYYNEVNAANFWKFDVHTNNWTKLNSWGSSPCPTSNTSADIDQARSMYVCIGTEILWKISLAAPYKATKLAGKECTGILNAPGGAPGWAYDPAKKAFIGWAGGDTVYLYDPDSDSCTTQSFPGGPRTIQALGTYGRFRYAPAGDIFVVVNAIDEDAFTLRIR